MKYLAALALAAISAPAFAQVASGPETFVAFATQVATNVDQGKAALVWDRASQSMKSNTSKDRFVDQVARKQRQNGTTVTRNWQSIVRSGVTGGRGQLVTVTFTVTTNRNTSYSEVIQFIAEQENVWRTSTYIN